MVPTFLAVAGRWPLGSWDTSISAFIVSSIAYVLYRIVAGRIRKKSWTDILSDGWKPATGSLWIDGALFAGVLLVMAAAIWAAMWLL